jgi:hypothetical protein
MSKPPVVIVRKDKRINHKLLHVVAFAATGGASGIVTAAEAANHAQYNARTRKLQADSISTPAPRTRTYDQAIAEYAKAAENRAVVESRKKTGQKRPGRLARMLWGENGAAKRAKRAEQKWPSITMSDTDNVE